MARLASSTSTERRGPDGRLRGRLIAETQMERPGDNYTRRAKSQADGTISEKGGDYGPASGIAGERSERTGKPVSRGAGPSTAGTDGWEVSDLGRSVFRASQAASSGCDELAVRSLVNPESLQSHRRLRRIVCPRVDIHRQNRSAFRPMRPFSSRILLSTMAILLILILAPLPSLASSGDRHPAFQHCLQRCISDRCEPASKPLPLVLRIFLWSCPSDCAYHCSHAFTTSLASEEGYHQFYGKWAFWRLAGIQEPASVAFSVANFWVHWRAWYKIRRRVGEACGLKAWLLGLTVVQMNTWFWSSVFHTRDLPFTEKMDYFSATANILYTCHYTLLRLFHLFTQKPFRARPSPTALTLSTIFVLLYIFHISYLLSTPRFDYGWNILFNTSVGAVHLGMWTCFSLSFQFRLPFPFSFIPFPYPPLDPLMMVNKPTYSYRTAALILTTTAAMSFELFDFPPLRRTIDAHSIWHLATAFIASGWYDFLLKDAEQLEAARLNVVTAPVEPEKKASLK